MCRHGGAQLAQLALIKQEILIVQVKQDHLTPRDGTFSFETEKFNTFVSLIECLR